MQPRSLAEAVSMSLGLKATGISLYFSFQSDHNTQCKYYCGQTNFSELIFKVILSFKLLSDLPHITFCQVTFLNVVPLLSGLPKYFQVCGTVLFMVELHDFIFPPPESSDIMNI